MPHFDAAKIHARGQRSNRGSLEQRFLGSWPGAGLLKQDIQGQSMVSPALDGCAILRDAFVVEIQFLKKKQLCQRTLTNLFKLISP